eukprot:TRINITY_DN14487_c1_g2_i1.p1 TRINITY_DN14487_c1_g2~~TRINITY_DN14487_c1_g2_i1.p1  ORF type:complete len:791 (-),score=68.62 TRINITY_DN14487_c1_g2_i1:29-2377(-)
MIETLADCLLPPESPLLRLPSTRCLRTTLVIAVAPMVTWFIFTDDSKLPAIATSPRQNFEYPVNDVKPNLTDLLNRNPHTFTQSDAQRFLDIAPRLLYQPGHLPRVLVFAFGDLTRMAKQFAIDGGVAGAASWYSRNLCYTQTHGFDLEFVSPRATSLWEPTEQKMHPRRQRKDGQLLMNRDDFDFWVMMREVQTHLGKGKYDYVFVMLDNMVLNSAFYEFPVWAYDLGHDITVTDEFKSGDPFFVNGILFRASMATHLFIQKVLQYHQPDKVVLKNGKGAFLETILTSLGTDAQARGHRGYENLCTELLYLGYKSRYDDIYAEHVARYSECFFSELERLAGPYGSRVSKTVGFLKTFLNRDDKILLFADVATESSLLPVPNCYHSLRYQQRWQESCFAYYLNDAQSAHLSQGAQPKCPDDSFPWVINPWATFYGSTDFLWFKHWSQRYKYKKAPRVLIYTWCTENSFRMFANEAFWKGCYAHAHGYEVVFSDKLNVTGVKKPLVADAGGFSDKWYSDDFMWAWNRDVQRYLFSGKYDYVFHVGADVLIHSMHLDFPLWAFDKGHDITIMDQDYVSYGFNQNAVLFKPTAFTREFLDLHYEHRTDYWLQGDNGPWMEAMLVYVGREAEAHGRPGYGHICAQHGILSMPSSELLRVNMALTVEKATAYSTCFFNELDRLAQTFGNRVSTHIGWSKVWMKNGYEDIVPEDNDLLNSKRVVMPWANCFTHVRDHWKGWQQNCFAFHWNGVKSADRKQDPTGTCPDPSFDWRSSPWNYANRQKSAI